MTEPRKCPEPGCPHFMIRPPFWHTSPFAKPDDWICPKTPEQHELAALRARNAELEAKVEWLQRNNDACVDESEVLSLRAQLDEAHKREVVLREALGSMWSGTEPCRGGCDHNVCAVLRGASESATAWLKAHDQEVLEKAVVAVISTLRGLGVAIDESDVANTHSAILGGEEP